MGTARNCARYGGSEHCLRNAQLVPAGEHETVRASGLFLQSNVFDVTEKCTYAVGFPRRRSDLLSKEAECSTPR